MSTHSPTPEPYDPNAFWKRRRASFDPTAVTFIPAPVIDGEIVTPSPLPGVGKNLSPAQTADPHSMRGSEGVTSKPIGGIFAALADDSSGYWARLRAEHERKGMIHPCPGYALDGRHAPPPPWANGRGACPGDFVKYDDSYTMSSHCRAWARRLAERAYKSRRAAVRREQQIEHAPPCPGCGGPLWPNGATPARAYRNRKTCSATCRKRLSRRPT